MRTASIASPRRVSVVIAKMTGRAVDSGFFFPTLQALPGAKVRSAVTPLSKLAASREGQRLARAFLAVKSPKLRSAFVNLLEGMLAHKRARLTRRSETA